MANWHNQVGDPVKKAKDQANHEDAVGGLTDSKAEAIPPPKNAEGKQMGKTTHVNNVHVIHNKICSRCGDLACCF
jgi:hypothetical protein